MGFSIWHDCSRQANWFIHYNARYWAVLQDSRLWMTPWTTNLYGSYQHVPSFYLNRTHSLAVAPLHYSVSTHFSQPLFLLDASSTHVICIASHPPMPIYGPWNHVLAFLCGWGGIWQDRMGVEGKSNNLWLFCISELPYWENTYHIM